MLKRACTICALLCAGCANQDYQRYVDAQAEYLRSNPARPLIVLEAHEGQQITGLKRLEINMPQQGGAAQIATPQPNQALGIVSQALGIVGTVGGIVAGGKAAQGLARAVGEAATVGYSHVQAPAVVVPQANVTTNTATSTDSHNLQMSTSLTTNNTSSTTSNTTTSTDNHSINSSYNPATTSSTTTYPVTTK